MEVDASVKLRELEILMQVSQNSPNDDLSLVANQLDELGIDHIPVIALRSGKQLRDLKLDYATDLINDLRTGMHFKSSTINLVERILESTKQIKDSGIYLIKGGLNRLDDLPLNHQQLNDYLKRTISRLRA